MVKLARKVRGRNDQTFWLGVLQLLHERDDDSIQFTNIKWIAAPLAECIDFIEHQHAWGSLRKTKHFSQVNGRLTKVSSNDAVKTNQKRRQAEFKTQRPRRMALPTARRSMKKKAASSANSCRRQFRLVTPLSDDRIEFLSYFRPERHIAQFRRNMLRRQRVR